MKGSSKNLLSLIQKGDKISINNHLAKFKERGIIHFPKVFEIELNERLPELSRTEQGRYEVLVAITASLKSLFSNINLRLGLNEDQLIEISNQIIEQSHADNLAIEDVLLFGQKFLIGEYGKIYDRMDVPTFFEFFEKYRQQRHEAILNIREEQHSQFKIMGRGKDTNSTIELKKDEDPQSILGLMQTFYDKENDGNNAL
jgi:hypothetical protein